MLAALFGCVIGQAVLFYMGTFYAYYFLERVARVDALTVTVLTAIALAIAAPLVLASGWLSDRMGRKPPLLGAVALAALLYFPLFGALLDGREPRARAGARETAPVVVARRSGRLLAAVRPARAARSLRRQLLRRRDARCLARAGISHATRALPRRAGAARDRRPRSLRRRTPARSRARTRAQRDRGLSSASARRRLPPPVIGATADPAAIDRPRVVAILVAAPRIRGARHGRVRGLLAEMFPARIRYTALSFPQNFGNGWFGGLLPAITFTIVAATGNVFAGLWYPVSLAALCLVVGWLALPETRGRPID